MECSICYENYNNKINKECKCPFCPFTCCRECIKTYIFGTLNEPHCMNCKNEFSNDTLYMFFTKTFMNTEYKNNRKNILYEREKSLFAETLRILGIETKKKELLDKKKELYKQYLESVKDIDLELLKLDESKPKEEKVIVRHCPVNDCKGYIDTAFKCTICSTKVCNKCYEVETEKHECNPDTIKTLESILKETQACPKCAVRIHKIEGCDNMWCTNCNVGFSYRTGKFINTNEIHNPHFAEFIRNGGQVDNNVNGCRETFGFHIALTNDMRRELSRDLQNIYINACNATRHVHTEMLGRRIVGEYGPEVNKDLRFKVLKGEMEEDDMKRMLVRREKDYRFKEEIRNVFNSLVVIMDRICLDIDKHSDRRNKNVKIVEERIREISKVIDATNKSLEELHKKYNRGTYKIEGAELVVAHVKSYKKKNNNNEENDAPARRRVIQPRRNILPVGAFLDLGGGEVIEPLDPVEVGMDGLVNHFVGGNLRINRRRI